MQGTSMINLPCLAVHGLFIAALLASPHMHLAKVHSVHRHTACVMTQCVQHTPA